MRLGRLLAESGVCSRRKAEDLVFQGRVAVNGKPAGSPNVEVDLEQDLVTVNGVAVGPISPRVHIALNKPRGYVCTTFDPQGRPTVLDLVRGGLLQAPGEPAEEGAPGGKRMRLFIAGRLDLDSEGLVILTNDGDLAQQITHPSYGVGKKYVVRVEGVPDGGDLKALTKGLFSGGEFIRADAVSVLETRSSGAETTLEVVVHEGKKREIRRMFEETGHPVKNLARIAIGPVSLGGLPPGSWRSLTEEELSELRKIAGASRKKHGMAGREVGSVDERGKTQGPCGHRHAGGLRGRRGQPVLRPRRRTDRAGDKVEHR